MTTFSSCFVGIPLPEQFESNFEKSLQDIKVANPYVSPVFTGTPHITLSYLGKQTEDVLEKIAREVTDKKLFFQHITITIGGLGYFTPHIPRVMFLQVRTSDTFIDNVQTLHSVLSIYADQDNHEVYKEYHPHLTLARIQSKAGQTAFLRQKSMLEKKLQMIQWTFPITEIVLYGVHPDKLPMQQRKLRSIGI